MGDGNLRWSVVGQKTDMVVASIENGRRGGHARVRGARTMCEREPGLVASVGGTILLRMSANWKKARTGRLNVPCSSHRQRLSLCAFHLPEGEQLRSRLDSHGGQ